ncbi:helicase POLQ-like [Plutella xylostella]|uniref:helicase POLQ-like n=1 Tax=Plutella xylostella TaxID=51655 RepID=UPI002033118F|nr:helicase POLQ-like [Plutella xylostella]
MLNNSAYKNSSTPKRRRLGTGRVLRHSDTLSIKSFSPVQFRVNHTLASPVRKCESPPIPSNQNEYLESSNGSSNSSYRIPQSPGFLECSSDLNGGICESDDENNKEILDHRLFISEVKELSKSRLIKNEIEDISDDMFNSKLEVQDSFTHNHEKKATLTSTSDKCFGKEIEESFEMVNESILCGSSHKNDISNNLFETKDSFLLDIKETGLEIGENGTSNEVLKMFDNINTFYGLPLMAKDLYKSLCNITKFYDWQEECLNLEAVRHRKNLIYALPTSGGKTLVAEVLMLREVLNRKHNVLFILPFVAIVQEKISSLSPFAVQLDFLIEEYAAGKGLIPPKKRRKKNSIYIATIEKALALVRSLIELNRLEEIGLIVVDELHLIGEAGRGSTLETLLSTVIFANKAIPIVGMSATIGNLPEVASFLGASVYQRDFRPVRLTEYVKLGNMLYRLSYDGGFEVVPHREISFDYSPAATTLDPDSLGGLVAEVTPAGCVLVFCPTKRNCENVAALLCKMQRKEMTNHRTTERLHLSKYLQGEGSHALASCVLRGVAFHHAGLGSEERGFIEQAFKSGVLSVLCCTSTLAAGVNLPASRVIIRAPLIGRAPMTLSAYRQMVGRAGRAGHCDTGESILICSERDWQSFRPVLSGAMSPTRSALGSNRGALSSLLLSAVALRLADTRPRLRELLGSTLMSVQAESLNININQICDETILSLLQDGAIEVAKKTTQPNDPTDTSHLMCEDVYIDNDTVFVVSELGNASIKGCLDLSSTRFLLRDLEAASRSLVLMGSLHLLYLVTPQDAAGVRPDYRHYYSLYCNFNDECLQTAKVLGITEKNAIKMITGKPITNVPELVLSRFYLALVLYDLWHQAEISNVCEKYALSRGAVQQLMSSSASLASSAARVCASLPARWALCALLTELAERLQHCAAPQIRQLCELPNVKKARALQLYRAGFKRVEDIARASVADLTALDHISRTAATNLISTARMLLIEKVENLRAEAEDVMEELNT